MTPVVCAFECYADQDVVHFLMRDCGVPLRGFHAFGQGEVVNEVLVRRRATLGLVDEDPGRVRHRLREAMPVVSSSADMEWRRSGDRHLIVVKPALEECVLRSFERVRFTSKLPATTAELHRLLNPPNPRKHEVFRQELAGGSPARAGARPLDLHHRNRTRRARDPGRIAAAQRVAAASRQCAGQSGRGAGGGTRSAASIAAM